MTATTITMSRANRDDTSSPEVVPQLVVLGTCDEPTGVSSRHSLAGVVEVRFGRGDRAAIRHALGGATILELRHPDSRMSGDHGRLVRGPTGWTLDDPRSKNGALVDGVMTRSSRVALGSLIELGHTFYWLGLGPTDPALPADVRADELRPPASALATFDGALAGELADLARLAPTTTSVIFAGETGTGKEVAARALHELSGRTGPFVAVNCGALAPTLLEAELFGHRKGAFSGAVNDRRGLIRTADKGTLFLDEIGELPMSSQVAFLRVLQEREVVPVGDDRAVPVDLRVCAATLRDLDAMVAAGEFRPDLFARLAGLRVELPPLRARRVDLGLLLRALLARRPGGHQVRFTPVALRALFRHDWPLNIRELDRMLDSALALSPDRVIGIEHLPDTLGRAPRPASPTPAPQAALAPAELDEADRELRSRLVESLSRHRGNVVAVATELGKRRTQIYRWAQRFGIDLDVYRR